MRKFFPLFLVSFLALFLELLVIRLIGTEIRIFAYLSNFTLLAIFVGSGLGMAIKKKIPLELTHLLLFLLTVVVTVAYVVRLPNLDFKIFSGITELLAPLSEDYMWLQVQTFSKVGIAIGTVLTVFLLLFIGGIFIPVGNVLGKLFDQEKKRPLLAYSVNVLASILGMWCFYLLSSFQFSPYLGLVIAQVLLLFLLRDRIPRYFALTVILVTIAFLTPKVAFQPYEGKVTYWSPYQKLSLSLINSKPFQPQGYYLEVNNVGYMGLLDLSNNFKATLSAQLKQSSVKLPPYFLLTDHYVVPYYLKKNSQSVLIIGSGGGNDVAAALRESTAQIDAVEIDPLIVQLGKRYHPERPYDDPRVTVIVDDGRSWLARANKKYDLIVMGLADSHTLSSSLTNLRLDNFLYTKESLTQAKKLLSDNGVLVLAFEVTRPWIGGHLQETISEVFGHQPIVFDVRSNGYLGWGGVIFAVAKSPDFLAKSISENPNLRQLVANNSRIYPPAEPLNDNWPYLYFPSRRIPILHLLIAAIVLLFLSSIKFLSPGKPHWNFFFLGAAFLLFEFQNVTKTSLLFGSTWMTNLFTISAILALILLANVVTEKKAPNLKLAFLGLLASFVFQFVVPVEFFAAMSFWPKVVLASLFLNLPLFFGGIIFATLFKNTKDRSGAFAYNLLGSAVGGFFEIFSFLFGINSLIIVSGVLYLLAFSFRKENV